MENVIKEPTPSVNSEYIKRYVGKFVVVYGKISSIKNNTIYLNLNPGKKVKFLIVKVLMNLNLW